jgi:PAS domain S-box-containing protein
MLITSQPELERVLGRTLFEQVPFNVAIIDRDFRVLAANAHFEEYFGDWQNRHCYEVYKGSCQRCARCQAELTFVDGRVRVSDETGVDRHGRTCHYVVHLAPLRDDDGEVKYIIEMTTDLTETRSWQREYDLFFERVPCLAFVIDRNFHIVRANEKFRETFGEPEGRFCFEVCKRRKSRCRDCGAALTFADGAEHVSNQVGVHRDGSPAYYVATSTPLGRGGESVAHVIEMAVDVTQVYRLQAELRRTHDFYESLIRNSPAAILALEPSGDTRIINPTARALLEWKSEQPPNDAQLREMLPRAFFEVERGRGELLELPEGSLRSAEGHDIPIGFSAIDLMSHGRQLGRGVFMQDLREIKKLEQEKLEVERLAAVGQTVAGLAHTIKNLLMGLEGGMYMVDTGLRRGDATRIANGWGVLQRNFEKTTALVKDFLNFAKGRLPELQPTDPVALARAIVNLYIEAARRQGVELVFEAAPNVSPAPLDPGGIEACLTNLLSNAIDAATLRENGGGTVVLRTKDEGDELVFEVVDNGCGMDWDVKGRVFTTFFTTKGGKGTGLGLLTTRKIVLEHGGCIEVESTPGQGSTFRVRLPRKRLQAIAEKIAGAASPEGVAQS